MNCGLTNFYSSKPHSKSCNLEGVSTDRWGSSNFREVWGIRRVHGIYFEWYFWVMFLFLFCLWFFIRFAGGGRLLLVFERHQKEEVFICVFFNLFWWCVSGRNYRYFSFLRVLDHFPELLHEYSKQTIIALYPSCHFLPIFPRYSPINQRYFPHPPEPPHILVSNFCPTRDLDQ